MDSLAWQTATFLRCGACGRIIDFWEPAGLTIAPSPETGRYMFTRVDPAEALCPECRIARSNEEDRAEFVAIYAMHRAEIAEIGIPSDTTVYYAWCELVKGATRRSGWRTPGRVVPGGD